MIFLAFISMLLPLVILAFVLFVFVFWILMLIDAIQRQFDRPEEKIIWVLVVLFLHFLGALIYYLMVKRKAFHP